VVNFCNLVIFFGKFWKNDANSKKTPNNNKFSKAFKSQN